MKKILTISIIALLFGVGIADIAFANIPQTASNSASNSLNQSQHIKWIGQLNMSKYSKVPPAVAKPVFNKTWQLSHPGSVIGDPSELMSIKMAKFDASNAQFAQNGTAIVKLSPEQISMKRQSSGKNSTTSGGVVASDVTPSINVYATSATYTWYWTQDAWNNNQITIYNPGPNVASGMVVLWSLDDGYGYANSFSNLGVGSSTTVSVPFLPGTGTAIGLKPIAIQVLDPNHVSSDWEQLPDVIEKFNNAPGYLADPNGGISLSSDDLSHFPYGSGYPIVCQAAEAVGSGVYTPDQAAYNLVQSINGKMRYCDTWPYNVYLASDLYIESHPASDGKYLGECKEYTTMFASYARSLGIPTEFYELRWNYNGIIGGHAMNQIWDGSSWISEDALWDVSNNPKVYTQTTHTPIMVWDCRGANAAKSPLNTYASQGLLIDSADWNVYNYLGYLPAYN